MKTAIVTGAEHGSIGLGVRIADRLERAEGFKVHRFSADVRRPQVDPYRPERLDLLVNCAGINLINWLDNVSEDDWDLVMDTNAKGLFLMVQHHAAALRAARGTVLNIVSNASHMPMRASAAYNASKGAAAILTKQLAREMAADGVTVFAVSPNKLANTGMSLSIDDQVCRVRGWTPEKAREYQLAGLLTGQETSPDACAEFCAWLLARKHRHIALAGCDLPYGA